MSVNAIQHAIKLIQCESVTPVEAGCAGLSRRGADEGRFRCTRLPFSEEGTADVDNLYAEIGSGAPHLMFAGHTDVVPPGNLAKWSRPPFDAVIENDRLYGRGAADMKGGIACFLEAALEFVNQCEFKGTISLDHRG